MSRGARVLRAVALALAVGGGLYALYRLSASHAAPPVARGAAAPRFVATTIDSTPRPRSLDDYRGRPLLLNVWATWCDPCREEMPSLQRLYESYKDRGLQVVAVSVDNTGDEGLIREFVAEHKLTFTILLDSKSAIMTQYQVRGVPQTFLISAAGEIRGTRFSADWASAESRALVERLLLDVPGKP